MKLTKALYVSLRLMMCFLPGAAHADSMFLQTQAAALLKCVISKARCDATELLHVFISHLCEALECSVSC